MIRNNGIREDLPTYICCRGHNIFTQTEVDQIPEETVKIYFELLPTGKKR
jgi:hypothetical protein